MPLSWGYFGLTYIFWACHDHMEVSRVGFIWDSTNALDRLSHEPLCLLQSKAKQSHIQASRGVKSYWLVQLIP